MLVSDSPPRHAHGFFERGSPRRFLSACRFSARISYVRVGCKRSVTIENITPLRLIIRLSVYFVVLITLIAATVIYDSDTLRFMPFGGTDALDRASGGVEIEITQSRLAAAGAPGAQRIGPVTPDVVGGTILFLASTLLSTVLIMIPITWTYTATSFDTGPSKVFVRALLVLPICASTVVLLIQDSLALAFGLAALVAAVRFRVALNETIDGIYIFAAICVGLSAGIGYLGVGAVMAMFFCLTSAILWHIDYGRNPVDDARRLAKEKKLKTKTAA